MKELIEFPNIPFLILAGCFLLMGILLVFCGSIFGCFVNVVFALITLSVWFSLRTQEKRDK